LMVPTSSLTSFRSKSPQAHPCGIPGTAGIDLHEGRL
jgi:hypothetical protein